MEINDRIEQKNKSIVFVSNTEEDENQGESEESISNVISLIGRKLNKFLKILDKIWRTNVEDNVLDNFRNIGP